MSVSTYSLDVLVQGFPGRTGHHGGLGWSTVSLLRGDGRVLLVDTGAYMYRDVLRRQLAEFGLTTQDVTGVLLTHCHSDHMCNYPLFPRATIYVPAKDLDWASDQPIGTWFVPEYHVEKLLERDHVRPLVDGQEVVPGISALATPGHTPGHMAYVAQVEGGVAIFTGDAVKNEAELTSGEADMSLDAKASGVSIAAIRGVALDADDNVIVPGHDRLLSVCKDRVVGRAPLVATIVRMLPQGVEAELNLVIPTTAATDGKQF